MCAIFQIYQCSPEYIYHFLHIQNQSAQFLFLLCVIFVFCLLVRFVSYHYFIHIQNHWARFFKFPTSYNDSSCYLCILYACYVESYLYLYISRIIVRYFYDFLPIYNNCKCYLCICYVECNQYLYISRIIALNFSDSLPIYNDISYYLCILYASYVECYLYLYISRIIVRDFSSTTIIIHPYLLQLFHYSVLRPTILLIRAWKISRALLF